jgi:hypothetical protein
MCRDPRQGQICHFSGLASRSRRIVPERGSSFLGETGFGGGLNDLIALSYAPAGSGSRDATRRYASARSWSGRSAIARTSVIASLAVSPAKGCQGTNIVVNHHKKRCCANTRVPCLRLWIGAGSPRLCARCGGSNVARSEAQRHRESWRSRRAALARRGAHQRAPAALRSDHPTRRRRVSVRDLQRDLARCAAFAQGRRRACRSGAWAR